MQRRQVEAFMLAFDSDFTPIVGQQVSTPPANPASRRFTVRSAKSKGVPSSVVPAPWHAPGDPTVGGVGAVLTVYNASGSGESVTVAMRASGWQRLGSATKPAGYRYRDSQRLLGPITSASVAVNGTLTVTASGGRWPYTLDEASQGAIAVRVQLGTGDTWCTRFAAKPSSSGGNDRVDKFDGAKAGAPGICPLLP